MEDKKKDNKQDVIRKGVIISLITLIVFMFVMAVFIIRDMFKDHECWEQGYQPESCQQFIPGDEKENN